MVLIVSPLSFKVLVIIFIDLFIIELFFGLFDFKRWWVSSIFDFKAKDESIFL